MNPPRLLLLTTDLLRGGTPTVVREIAVRIRQLDVAVEVACLAGPGPTGDEIAAAGVPVHPLGARTPADLHVLSDLARHIDRRGFTHVLSFLLHANAAAAWTARRRPHIHWFQSIQTTQPRPRWHWPLQRWAARHARRIIVPSRSVADIARQRCRIDPDRIVVIPNGVDPRCFDVSPPTPDDHLVRVGFIGRLDPVKRVHDLIHAVASLEPRYHLHIFGDGPERHALQRLAHARQLAPRVRFHGAIPEPATALRQIDLLVLPSQAEGFGMVLVEAMAAGVPVVASRAPGIVDVVDESVTGLLYPVGDTAALAHAIQIATLEPARTARTQAARGTVRQRYNWDPLTRQYLDTLGISPPPNSAPPPVPPLEDQPTRR